MADPQGTDDLARDAALLRQAVEDAGKIAMRYFGRSPSVSWKAPNNPVSEADLAIDSLLRTRLHGERPSYGWLSEESGEDDDRLYHRRVWVVDPIDGTRAFLAGDDSFAISVALLENGRPVLGAIVRPAREQVYFARAEGGATLNGRPIRVSDRKTLDACRIIADKVHFRSRKVWPKPWPDMTYVAIPSTALRLAAVGEGSCDAMIALRPKADWDLAAADLLVHEAGGRVIDATGEAPIYNRLHPKQPFIVAANPHLLPEIDSHLAHWRIR